MFAVCASYGLDRYTLLPLTTDNCLDQSSGLVVSEPHRHVPNSVVLTSHSSAVSHTHEPLVSYS